jgi:hypothetical protein
MFEKQSDTEFALRPFHSQPQLRALMCYMHLVVPGLRRDVIWQIAERECFRFHFQVDLRVNVRGVQGDMPEPSPDGIDVHAGAKQMDRTRMSKTVRANALCRD